MLSFFGAAHRPNEYDTPTQTVLRFHPFRLK
jgi:hypothetical protein